MTIPTVAPIVVPLPSLVHRKICVAGLARGTPDSGEAAIMGVPLPHLVLPEARGHRSALAQNSLLMCPLLFPSFGLVVGLVCPRHMVDWPQCVCAAVATPCMVSPDGVTLWTCGSPNDTQHDGVGHVHTVAMSGSWCTAGVNGGATLLGTMVPARLCVSIAVVQPTLVTPDGRRGVG